jgi:hypothetical protein
MDTIWVAVSNGDNGTAVLVASKDDSGRQHERAAGQRQARGRRTDARQRHRDGQQRPKHQPHARQATQGGGNHHRYRGCADRQPPARRRSRRARGLSPP